MIKVGMGQKQVIHPGDIVPYGLDTEISPAIDQDIFLVMLYKDRGIRPGIP